MEELVVFHDVKGVEDVAAVLLRHDEAVLHELLQRDGGCDIVVGVRREDVAVLGVLDAAAGEVVEGAEVLDLSALAAAHVRVDDLVLGQDPVPELVKCERGVDLEPVSRASDRKRGMMLDSV